MMIGVRWIMLSLGFILFNQVERGEAASVLRRRKVDRGDYRQCPKQGPDVWIFLAAENPSFPMSSMQFSADPTLPRHRTYGGYDDADVIELWEDAIAHFRDHLGVDFSGIQSDEAGGKTSPDGFFYLVAQQPPFESMPQQMGSSIRGSMLDCPSFVNGELIALDVIQEGGMFHGLFGGSEGVPAIVGSRSAFGATFTDTDNDGTLERCAYQSRNPMIMSEFGGLSMDLAIFHDQWGPGRQYSYFLFDGVDPEKGVFDVHVTSHITFPAVW